MADTHPLYAAIDAALAAHGWPDGTKHIGLSCPAMGDYRCAVTLGTFGSPVDDVTAVAASVASAADKAAVKQAERPDEITRARAALVAAGLSPDLVAA